MDAARIRFFQIVSAFTGKVCFVIRESGNTGADRELASCYRGCGVIMVSVSSGGMPILRIGPHVDPGWQAAIACRMAWRGHFSGARIWRAG
jgi:hypothetical protein